MKKLFLISVILSFLLGCANFGGSANESAPKCADVISDGKVYRNCR